MSWTWWGTARWHEDIWGECDHRDIAVSGRAGWPTAPCRATEVAMSSPFGLAAQGGRNRLPVAGRRVTENHAAEVRAQCMNYAFN